MKMFMDKVTEVTDDYKTMIIITTFDFILYVFYRKVVKRRSIFEKAENNLCLFFFFSQLCGTIVLQIKIQEGHVSWVKVKKKEAIMESM